MAITKFDRYVDRHAGSFVERLQALCRMPSVAARGTGMRAVAETVEQMMQRVGAGTRSFRLGSGFPIIYGEFGAGSHCFVVYGHYDVQPVGQLQEWACGPFAASVLDDKLYARGAANSKGDLVARLAAVEAYQKTFGKLPFCLRFIVEGEDGLGSPSLYRFTSEHADLLRAEDRRVIEVRAATEPVTTASTGDTHLLARAAYHLGNRHVALQIGEGWVRYLADHVLDAMVGGLGLGIVHEERPFEPEIGAYSGSNHRGEV